MTDADGGVDSLNRVDDAADDTRLGFRTGIEIRATPR